MYLITKEDHLAFKVIYDTYRNRIYSYAFKLTKSEAEANDIVQEVFMKFWNSKRNIAHIQDIRAYITTIARNEFFRAYKQKLKRQAGISVIGESMRLTEENTVEIDFILKQQMEAIAHAIDNLPPQQKMVYDLSRNNGMKLEKIAEHMNISVHTVKVHLSRALQTLRDQLKNNPDLAILIFFYLM